MRRHFLILSVLWLILTVVGVMAAREANIYPIAGSKEAEDIDAAFTLLMMLSAPVFFLVLLVLVYSAIVFRHRGQPTEDGSPIQGHKGITWAWVLITSGLAIYVIFNPGLTGLKALSSHGDPDLVVKVEATQWHWNFAFPQYGIRIEDAQELILPVNQRVKFEISSDDVIHSFWLPAFRMKQDAVPGRTTTMYITTGEPMNFDDDSNIRVQCAELCGTGHARMQTRLSIVEHVEFQRWIAEFGAQ